MELSRRNIVVGGGVGAGLLVAWGLWPRAYPPSLATEPGEQAFGAWLKIGRDGIVTVAVPQAEHGQGIATTLAQVVADELGADWRTVAVEPAPLGPLYANPVGVDSLFEGAFGRLPDRVRDEWLRRDRVMLTAGSSSLRMFEGPARAAAATARALMAQAAARRWGVDWSDCEARDGFIVHGNQRLRFAELAEAAAGETVPHPLPLGSGGAGQLAGKDVPRLDSPAKLDGSANFTADIRLPEMVHVALRHAPLGRTRAIRIDRAAAMKVPGVIEVIEGEDWVAVAAGSWWIAQKGLDAAAPRGQVMKDGLQDFMEQVVVQRRAGEVNKASAAYSALLPADAPDRGWAPWKQAKSYRWLSCVNLHSGIYPAVVNRDLTYLGGIPECRDRDIPSLVVRHDDEATEFVVGPLPGPLTRRLLSLLTGDRSVSVLAIAGDSPELPGPEPDWVDPRRGGGPAVPDGDGYVRIRVGRAR